MTSMPYLETHVNDHERSGHSPAHSSTPHYIDEQITLWCGDTLDTLRALADQSVNCVVTSPPYYALRDYGQPGQYGLEATPAEYVATMRAVFAEVRRVLAADGTLWLNLGDSYASTGETGRNDAQRVGRNDLPQYGSLKQADRPGRKLRIDYGVPAKNLLGIPWRVAFALQDDGWILRNHIVWAKTNAMPESVTDRLSTKHEALFLLTRSSRYWFDLDAIREQQSPESVARATRGDHQPRDGWSDAYRGTPPKGLAQQSQRDTAVGSNPGDVWSIPTQPFAAAHFAVFPPALAERCVKAGCKPGGVVLDPFCGSGTTGMVALRHGRRFAGIDLSADYLNLALQTRLAQGVLMFDEVAS